MTSCLVLGLFFTVIYSDDTEPVTSVTYGFAQETPLRYSRGPSIHQLTSQYSSFGLNRNHSNGRAIQFELTLTDERLESVTSPGSIDLEKLTEQEWAAILAIQQPWHYGVLTLSSEANQDFSSRAHSLELGTEFGPFSSTTGMTWSEDLFDPSLLKDDLVYTLSFTTQQLLFDQSLRYSRDHHSFGGQITTTIGSSEKATPQDDFHALMHPFLRAYQVSYEKQLGLHRNITLALSSSRDTLNADLEQAGEVVGKIFDRDMGQTKLSLSFVSPGFHIGLSYNDVWGETGGYLLAAPFGDLLTQLSGARNFFRGEYSLTYIEFSAAQAWAPSSNTRLNTELILYAGQGHIDFRSYIWQLFNPVQDLVRREATLDSYIVSNISAQVDIKLSPALDLQLSGRQLLPLHIAYDLEGTSTPESSETEELILGRHLALALIYHF